MSAQHLTHIEIESIAHRIESMRDAERDPINRQALTHAARMARAMPEVIQCGDVLRQEVEATAYELDQGCPGSGSAKMLAAFASQWNSTVSAFRED